jgi:hypothetical protein
MKLKTTFYLFLIAIMPFYSCSKSDDSGDDNQTPEKPDLGTPATEHHETDGVTDNGDGTSGVTMASELFHTVQNDFSSEAVVTADKTPSSNIEDVYPLGSTIMSFRVNGSLLVVGENPSAFETKMLLYDMSTKKKLDEHEPDEYHLTGFDYNGAIMTIEGNEDLNFYKIENNKIAKHFFQVKSFMGSKFLGAAFLDDDHAYVYDSDKIYYFHLGDSKNASKALDVASFSRINFDSDENFVYAAVGDWNSSEIKKFDKKTKSEDSANPLSLNFTVNGIAIDANYIYLSDKDNNKLQVFNKHTGNHQGDINIKSPTLVDYSGGYVYVFSEDNNSVNKLSITYN